jgi:hypothetical protein
MRRNLGRYGCLGCLADLLARADPESRLRDALAVECILHLLDMNMDMEMDIDAGAGAGAGVGAGADVGAGAGAVGQGKARSACPAAHAAHATTLHDFGPIISSAHGRALSDVTFLVGPTRKPIHAHRAILAASRCTDAFAFAVASASTQDARCLGAKANSAVVYAAARWEG